MLIKYKTIVFEKDDQLLYEVKNIDFCCSEAKNAYENKLFIFNAHDKQTHNLHLRVENSVFTMIYPKINYCPFCKAEIKTKEVEKVKTIRKTVKETIEIYIFYFIK